MTNDLRAFAPTYFQILVEIALNLIKLAYVILLAPCNPSTMHTLHNLVLYSESKQSSIKKSEIILF
jgi:hypothetical protein